jgi:diadenosine tetraphosphate (Ap4A) HIT family hydrolase
MSPTVFRERGYRFFFFSREEPRIHVHVISGDGEAKFWLEPEIELAKNFRYSRKQIKEIEILIEEHYSELISAWREHFGS